MNRLLTLAAALVLCLSLFAACSQTDNPADPIVTGDSPDKKGENLPGGNPTALDSYLHEVYYSFDAIADDLVEVEYILNQFTTSQPITVAGYPPLYIDVQPPLGAPTGYQPPATTIKFYLPPPPEDPNGYFDFFGDNLLFGVSEMPDPTVALVTLHVPITSWNNPAGLAKNMYIYSLCPRSGSPYFDPFNVQLFEFPQYPLPEGEVNYLQMGNPGTGEPDDANTTVWPPPRIPVVGDDEDPVPPPIGG